LLKPLKKPLESGLFDGDNGASGSELY